MSDTHNAPYRPVIVLDTNAVHYAKLALTFSIKNGVDIETTDWPAFKKRLESAKLGQKAVEKYKNGYWVIRYVRKLTTESAEVYFSPITGLELLCGSLRGEAIKRAAAGGVPNRWYTRVEEEEVRQELEPDGYAQVAADQGGIKQQFDDAGIAIIEHEPDREVWELARVILQNIFIDVQDCLVYASAICLQATEVLTWDGYLGQIVQWTQNPGSAKSGLAERFGTLNKSLIDRYAQLMGWNADQVILPRRRHINDIEKFLSVGADGDTDA